MKVRAFFGSLKTANETVSMLQSAGFNQAYVDMNDNYIDWDAEINSPGTATGTRLSGLTLSSSTRAVEERFSSAAAASPMASGYGRFEEVADINCTVVVDVNGINTDKAQQILREMGGDLDNPNISAPEMTADTDLFLEQAINQITDSDI